VNPFDFSGQAFLLFYLGVGVAAIALMSGRRKSREGRGDTLTLSDPYLIAYLRGGAYDALRVATVSLVDSGLLTVERDQLQATRSADEHPGPPVERAVLDHFSTQQPANTLYRNPGLEGLAESELGEALKRQGLLPDDETRRERRGRLVLTMALLWILAFIKVVLALSRGRTNVVFLCILAIVFSFWALAIHSPRRTARGDAMLKDLRALFRHLWQRAAVLRPGSGTAEAAFLAAVFGLAALPGTAWAYTRTVFPRATASTSGTSCGSSSGWGSSSTACGSSSSGSSGASCSSGSSDGGGPSCGGGGGCGGCGGGGCGGGGG
jgi:uncharacterized protein (TIGR04222 family)